MPLFPLLTPYATHMLPVGQGHTLYVEESGSRSGLPVIVLHGGPGSGCNEKHRQRFNPHKYRIICFDQRGCGRSQFEDRLAANTTDALIEDIARIRTHLGLTTATVVYGTSWGSTLALAYAQTYPQTVSHLILGGIFLGTPHELNWMAHPTGAARFYPVEYAAITELLGNPPPDQVIPTMYLALTGANPAFARQAALAWSRYEALCSTPVPNRREIEEFLAITPNLHEHAALECHYFNSNCFLEPDQLLINASRIAHIPTQILQGQLDMVCPPETAHRLHAALPNSTLTLVENCGHSASPDMEEARVTATNALI